MWKSIVKFFTNLFSGGQNVNVGQNVFAAPVIHGSINGTNVSITGDVTDNSKKVYSVLNAVHNNILREALDHGKLDRNNILGYRTTCIGQCDETYRVGRSFDELVGEGLLAPLGTSTSHFSIPLKRQQEVRDHLALQDDTRK